MSSVEFTVPFPELALSGVRFVLCQTPLMAGCVSLNEGEQNIVVL